MNITMLGGTKKDILAKMKINRRYQVWDRENKLERGIREELMWELANY